MTSWWYRVKVTVPLYSHLFCIFLRTGVPRLKHHLSLSSMFFVYSFYKSYKLVFLVPLFFSSRSLTQYSTTPTPLQLYTPFHRSPLGWEEILKFYRRNYSEIVISAKITNLYVAFNPNIFLVTDTTKSTSTRDCSVEQSTYRKVTTTFFKSSLSDFLCSLVQLSVLNS